MPTILDDLDQYFSPGLQLTVRGKTYTVPLASAELGLWCRRMAMAAGDITAASTEAEVQAVVDRIQALPELPGHLTLPERTLGATYGQMVADEVPDPYIEFCGSTAYVWIVAGEEAAARWWQSGGRRPERSGPPNRAARRASAKTGATSTGAETVIPSPASTSGTKSRKRSGRRRRPQT